MSDTYTTTQISCQINTKILELLPKPSFAKDGTGRSGFIREALIEKLQREGKLPKGYKFERDI